jgi:outer membrane lipoprotein SlyB
MQCRAIAIAMTTALMTACATPGYYDRPASGPRYVDSWSGQCRSCGTVERIERVTGPNGSSSSGGGAVLGAIVGGALGNTIGKGDGRKAATIAGAVAGGVIGNEIERNQAAGSSDTWFEVFVRMDDGQRIVTRQYGIAGLREGSRVELRDGAAFPR